MAEALVTIPWEAEMTATVLRCDCGDPDSHNGSRGPAAICPNPRIEVLGVIATGSSNDIQE